MSFCADCLRQASILSDYLVRKGKNVALLLKASITAIGLGWCSETAGSFRWICWAYRNIVSIRVDAMPLRMWLKAALLPELEMKPAL